jgi:signal transduction histidine kinase
MHNFKYFITTVLFLVSFSSFGQLQKDSAFLENAFIALLSKPQQEDSLKNELHKKLDFSNDTLADYYDFIYSKFLFRTGQFERALAIINSRLENSPNSTIKYAKYFNLRGAVYSLQNNTNQAVNDFIEASRRYENGGNLTRAALIKNNIANIYFGLNKHEKAYNYLIESYTFLKDFPDNEHYPKILGTLAISSALTNRYEESRKYADEGLSLAHKKNDSVALSLLNYAKGELALSSEDYSRAESYLKISISIAQQFNLRQNKLLGQILLMKTYNLQKNYSNAAKLGEQALNAASQSPNKTTFIAIHRGLKDAYSAEGNYQKAFYHFNQLDSLQDLNRSESIEAKTDSLLIAFESEKKDLALKMKDIDILQAEEKVKNQQLFVAVLILMLIVLLGFVLLYIRTKKAQLMEIELKKEKELIQASMEGEKKERSRLARELHDGISSELTALKIKLTNEEGDIETIKNIASLQVDVRRMAHSLSPFKLQSFGLSKALEEHFSQMSNATTKIYFTSNLGSEELRWNENTTNILYRTIQELVQNAMKHADAHNIDVQINYQKENKQLNITVEDDGKGFDYDALAQKPNVVERAKAIEANIEYDTQHGKGTTVMMHLNI